jgi:hypothetical protein
VERSYKDKGWYECGGMNAMSNVMDDKTGKEATGTLFADKLKKLYNSVSFEKSDMKRLIDEIESKVLYAKCEKDHGINMTDIKGKNDSIECLQTDHFIHGSNSLITGLIFHYF